MANAKESFREQLITYIRAAFPLICIDTVEVERVTEELRLNTRYFNENILAKIQDIDENFRTMGMSFRVWNTKAGWGELAESQPQTQRQRGQGAQLDTTNPVEALYYLLTDQVGPGVYVMQNAHFYWQDTGLKPYLVQAVRDIHSQGQVMNKTVIFVGAFTDLPVEVHQYFVTLEYKLPDKEVAAEVIKEASTSTGVEVKPKELEELAQAALGMTAYEMTGAVCIAATKKGIDKEILFNEKAKAVRRSGLLEYIPTHETMQTIGGLTTLKDYFTKVAKAFKDRTRADKYSLPIPKGCLITGIAGTGKTLSAKAIASLFGIPLFRLDVGRVFGGIVGETEKNTRNLTSLIDAVSPAVIMIDEVEKSLDGINSSGNTDGGVTSRFIASLLYYMQEKESLSFFVFTANDVSKLPAPLMRKGRLDELFFVDLPYEAERTEIAKIHLSKVNRNPKDFDIKAIVAESQGLTGAEIEAGIKSAMYEAFFQDREFTTEDIVTALSISAGIADTKQEEVEALRKWRIGKARLANGEEKKEKLSKKRKVMVDGGTNSWEKEVGFHAKGSA